MKKLFILLLVFTSLNTLAQYRDLHFEHLNVVEGLPESQILALHQDKEGYVWIGTQNGLVRYDGYRLKVYKLGSEIKGSLKDFAADDIYETKDGDLWVSTRVNALYHYKRTADSFEQFKLSGKYNGFAQKKITIDDDGYLWLYPRRYITAGSILRYPVIRLNTKTGRDVRFPYSTTAVFNSKTGKLWLATEKGLVYYDRLTGKMSKAFFPQSGKEQQMNMLDLYEAPSQPGMLWVEMVDNKYKPIGLFAFDTGSHLFKKYVHNGLAPGTIASDSVYTIHEDSKGRLWFGTARGISLFDRRGENFKNYAPADPGPNPKQDHITAIAQQPDGKLWLAAYRFPKGNGLLLFDPVNETFKRYIHDEKKPYSLNINDVSVLLVDHTGLLWAGMAWGGLDRVNSLRSQFNSYLPGGGDKKTYPDGGADGIARSADGYCWLGSKEGLIRWKPGTDVFERIKLPGYIQRARVFYADREGLIWCSSGNVSLFAYNPKTASADTLKTPGKWLTDPDVRVICQDRAGIIWIGTNKGLYSYDKNSRKFLIYPYEPFITEARYSGKKLDNAMVRSIYEDKQGVIWIGTNLGGLNRYNKQDGTFTSFFDMTSGLNCVLHIYEDKAGRFWLGTYLSGLYLFDRKSGKTEQITEKEGLLDDDVHGILEDPDGNLWLSGQRGLTVFNPGNYSCIPYSTKNALSFAFGKTVLNVFIKTGDNQFIYASRNGLLSFYPNQLIKNTYPPQVQIETASHNDPQSNDAQVVTEGLYDRKQIELPHNQNRISFNYVALHYENPAQNQYAYQLVGYDKKWVQAGTQHSVTYTNLSPGTYTFKVKASNSDGIWNEKGASIVLVINPPWWATWWAWLLWIALFVSTVYAVIAYRSRKLLHDKKVLEHKVHVRTEEVMQQKEEIETQRDNLEQTIGELKATQSQLVQSEKMASLGELTAGIAHEIQNPLNFVNNFSEVNAELIGEMKQEIAKGDLEEIKVLASDIEENSNKINMHGRRADAIVKSMLQHSQSGSANKEPININALADEYLRLSYHGLRAKDKEFNAGMTTDYDPSLPKVNAIAQDIGRVLLNLFNNAFYAVNQKAKTSGQGYKPEISVSTSTANGQVVIKVKDNGIGIPDAVKEKIMQPFFTTKPTGEGTGLGLSLTYDMVVKGHGGNISVDTKEGEGSAFTVTLPIN